MPPSVPRKRLRNTPPPSEESQKSTAKAPEAKTVPRKATLYDDLDTSVVPVLSKNNDSIFRVRDESDELSSLSSLSDQDFEDVPLAKRQKLEGPLESDDDDDVEFEDVAAPVAPTEDAPVTSGDLELTLNRDTRISLTNLYGEKRGATNREKKVRHATHSLHVLTLLWHNSVRNGWLCDLEVQATMISHLTPRMWEEVDRWKQNSGLDRDQPIPKTSVNGPKPKGKAKTTREKAEKGDVGRRRSDWSEKARKLEEGAIDMSHGDPLFRLMQSLVSWWKLRFKVTVPGLRKWGYMGLERLDRVTKAYKANPEIPGQFGERFSIKEDFRKCARECQGSRDVGAQLFVALLRGLGIEARMVANLQSLGFGWNKFEDAEPEKDAGSQSTSSPKAERKTPKPKDKIPAPTSIKTDRTGKGRARNMKMRGPKNDQEYVVVDSTDELELEHKDTDDESVVEIEATPKRAKQSASPKIDHDLEYPVYWAEVLSPVTNKYLAVDPIVKGIVATNRDLIESLEPRGAKADKARLIMAYVVAYSHDGTAKDVTVRYLRKQIFPGRAKAVRMPVAKSPVYNKHGKVKRYEHYDWFKAAMAGYIRGTKLRPLTDIDELEDSTDLKPAEPQKKDVKEGEETLQYYKQSKEFVLERHFKREEALKPGSKPVKVFKNKAKGGKVEEEDVYLRSDVLNVKSAETWHKQGRAPQNGELPLKRVPYRAATTNRRRELMEAEMATGEKVLQGLFSWDQTDWIIPAPIENGIIPKNGYGNIDLFAEHMCPQGATHVPFRGAMKVCKRIGIDYAEAVVDFEFGHRMAVPVIQGVVIASEFHDQVMEEIQKDEAERTRKEDEKRRKAALSRWRKFLMGMRIVEQVKKEYGGIDDNMNVFAHNRGNPRHATPPAQEEDAELGGGFLPEGYEDDVEEEDHQKSSFFPVGGGDDDEEEHENDGLIMEDHQTAEQQHQEPNQEPGPTAKPDSSEASNLSDQSLTDTPRRSKRGQSSKMKPTTKAETRRKPRAAARQKIVMSEGEAEDDESSAEWVDPDESDQGE